MSRITNLLLRQRKRLGLSLEEISRRSGLSYSYIRHIAKGRRLPRRYETLMALVNVLDIPYDEIASLLREDVADRHAERLALQRLREHADRQLGLDLEDVDAED